MCEIHLERGFLILQSRMNLPFCPESIFVFLSPFVLVQIM